LSATLIIIDMQRSFYEANAMWLIKNLQEEIEKSMKNKEGILFVEYDGFGPTHWELTRLVKNYPNHEVVRKQNDNGGKEVLDKLAAYYYNTSTIKVGGVNIDVCVAKTVTSLSRKLKKSKVSLLTHCCNGPKGADFSWMRHLNNVVLEKGEKYETE
jgi:hypothetical protein